ncbi:MAG: metal ABC transporter permease [Paracoccaceae bacterium]
MQAEFIALSLVPILVATLAALACALPGNFLLLRRQSLLGDAISHVVLPGIVAAYLLTGITSTPAMLAGALAAAALSVLMIEGLRRGAGVEPGAAMGIVFTTMFAAGVVLLEQSGASGVHLDVEHALYGNLESLIWLDATGWASLTDPAALATLPPELARMALVTLITAISIALLWRPLTLASFDEGFARTIGLPVRALSAGLIALAALAAVAAFSAVGSILVIAMLVCPPAAARLLTTTVAAQVTLSLAFAAFSAITGYILAGYAPLWVGLPASLSAAGMIAVVAGLILAAAIALSRKTA